jgi:hypothetical protein
MYVSVFLILDHSLYWYQCNCVVALIQLLVHCSVPLTRSYSCHVLKVLVLEFIISRLVYRITAIDVLDMDTREPLLNLPIPLTPIEQRDSLLTASLITEGEDQMATTTTMTRRISFCY